MREIKFRAWLKWDKRILPVKSIIFETNRVSVRLRERFWISTEFNEIELMESTGLKDRNGTEIYEGDIINYKYGRHTSTQFVVKYDEFQATFVVVDNHNDLIYTFRELADYIQLNSLEVIGNIYENKELLEEEVKDD